MATCDAVIIGAGPYGLSVAAHLRQVKGLDLRVFGEPMSFWERHMPEGMLLRSPRVGSHLYDPDRRFSLDAFDAEIGKQEAIEPPPTITEDFILRDIKRRVKLSHFIRYGHWFHDRAGVASDHRKILRIEPALGGYRLTIEDGTSLDARRVIVAGGIEPFAFIPGVFADLPAPLVMHTSQFRNLEMFRDKKVLIVGGGQSALETAALLYEGGAHVEVSLRRPLRWFGLRWQWTHEKPFSLVMYGRGDVGQAGISVLVQHPTLYRRLPRSLQDKFGVLAIRAGASNWVMARTRHVSIDENQLIERASVEGERVRVRSNDGKDRVFDHVILGTGYRVNVALYPFLAPQLLERVAMVNGYPRLDSGFETTSPGLHFVGAPAAWSFGPLMRFVDGTEFVSSAVMRRVRKSDATK